MIYKERTRQDGNRAWSQYTTGEDRTDFVYKVTEQDKTGQYKHSCPVQSSTVDPMLGGCGPII